MTPRATAVVAHADSPAALTFPFPELPAPGTTIEVAPGVHWLRMPLPFALNHINLWLLRDGSGWSIVDTGLNTDVTRDLWDQVLESTVGAGAIRRAIVTHYHPDHFGLAGWLTRRFGVDAWMAEGEYLLGQAFYQGFGRYNSEGAAALFALHGLGVPQLDELRGRGNGYQQGVSEPPLTFVRIMEGDTLSIHGRTWRAIMGYGHAPEHAALYCKELGVLISGDMVLPKISTNVSVWAAEPEGDPLRLFLRSVARYAELPEDTLVLPSHGLPFTGLRERAAQLHAHHDARLQELLAACTRPRTAAEVLPVLFHRELDSHQLLFAMGEAIAHLNHLMYSGRLRREGDADGTLRFEAPDDSRS